MPAGFEIDALRLLPLADNRALSTRKLSGISSAQAPSASSGLATSTSEEEHPMLPRPTTLLVIGGIAATIAIGLVESPKADRIEQPLIGDGVVRVESAYAIGETVERLKKDLAAKGIMMFFTVDQAKLAADASIKLRPSMLLVFGNPTLGAQFITSKPQAGLDWPVRLLVQEDEQGRVWATYTDFTWIRAAAPHHRSRRRIQDGVERDRVDYI
jgi:uncharacterized protein (DUF302 family)